MILYLHDANTGDPVTGTMKSPTHCGTIRGIDYDYQIEMWLEDIFRDHPRIVRVECSDGRNWHRGGSRFRIVETQGEPDVRT